MTSTQADTPGISDLCSLAIALNRDLAQASSFPEVSRTMAVHASRFPGLRSCAFEPDADPTQIPPFEYLTESDFDGNKVRTLVAANGIRWGTLTAWCSLTETQSRLAVEFLAQQLALALNNIKARELKRKCDDLLRGLNDELQTRKALHRASGVVARWYGVSERAAEVRIRAIGRQSGRSVKTVATAVIEAETLPIVSASVRA